ncbi:hypothetical protein [Helicobacter pylori]|nr:hypothetical protein [Helicobacter pylori]
MKPSVDSVIKTLRQLPLLSELVFFKIVSSMFLRCANLFLNKNG